MDRMMPRTVLHVECLRSRLLLLWVATFGAALLLFANVATAQSSGNMCLKSATGLNNPSCTANDVRIGRLELVSGPSSCSEGQVINVTLKATIESGPARYAVGIWINTDGGDARDDTDPVCYRDFLSPVDASAGNNQCQQQGGPYFDADGDTCGDVYAVGTNPCGNGVFAACTEGGGTCLFSTVSGC